LVSSSLCGSIVSSAEDSISEQQKDDDLESVDGNDDEDDDDNDTATFFDFKTRNVSVSAARLVFVREIEYIITLSARKTIVVVQQSYL